MKKNNSNYLFNMLGLHSVDASSNGYVLYDIYKGKQRVGSSFKENKGLVHKFDHNPATFVDVTESSSNCFDGFIGVRLSKRFERIDYMYIGKPGIFNFLLNTDMFELSKDGILIKDKDGTIFIGHEDIMIDKKFSSSDLSRIRNVVSHIKSLVPDFFQSPEIQYKDEFNVIFPSNSIKKAKEKKRLN